MHRSSSFHPNYLSFRPQPTVFDIKDQNLKSLIDNLMFKNEELSQKLHLEKNKNYQMGQNKRRMEEDIQRLQFQLQRISNNETLSQRQMQVKKNQVMQENSKVKIQLDNYLEQNKKIRAEMRKWVNECEQVNKQKQDLVKQNVILMDQVNHLKQLLSGAQKQVKQYRSMNTFNQQSNQLKNIGTVRSTNPSIQYIYSSPKSQYFSHQNREHIKHTQISTNPSEGKISFASPITPKSLTNIYEQPLHELAQKQSRMQQQIQNPEPSPRSFTNKIVKNSFDFTSPYKKQSTYSYNYSVSKQSPSVYAYGSEQSPMMQLLKLDQRNYQQNLQGSMLNGIEKRQLKDQVSGLRDQLVEDLIQKYYNKAIKIAQIQKTNSLKIFISNVSQKMNTLTAMSKNYLKARSMLSQSCPTLRLKWQPLNPLLSNQSNISSPNSASSLFSKNTFNISTIYESIKQNSKKQNTVTGQYLTLFRYLTLLSKVGEDVNQFLVSCVKHSAVKQIFRIWKTENQGNTNANENEDQFD